MMIMTERLAMMDHAVLEMINVTSFGMIHSHALLDIA
jgi:hypothetical protein